MGRALRFVVAGGGVAGLAAALALARTGHSAVVLERDAVSPEPDPDGAFDVPRHGIPHFLQPHAFLPRGLRELKALAPDVLDALMEAGADPQDLAEKLNGPRRPGDEELVYLWVRRPVIEWALRRAAGTQEGVELRSGVDVAGVLIEAGRATGVALRDGERVTGDVVVDALGRYRFPRDWPRPQTEPSPAGPVYYCRYFALEPGVEHLDAPILNPRGDLGYMGFNVFRGDNRTYAVIYLVPSADRDLRALKGEAAWMAAAARIPFLDVITAPDHGRPITPILPMGGQVNVDWTGDPGVRDVVAIGDAICHTDPAYSYGVAFALSHARALAAAAQDGDDIGAAFRAAAGPEARERHALACATNDARVRRWAGEPLDITRRDGSYPLFSFAAALTAAPHDDHVLRRAIRRIGLLDRTAVFDEDAATHERIEEIVAGLGPPPAWPPREELVAALSRSPR